MANNYVKPNIAFQDLAMRSEVSASCAMTITFGEFVCPVEIPEWGETVYTANSSPRCDWTNDDYYICYHVPTIGTNVFGS